MFCFHQQHIHYIHASFSTFQHTKHPVIVKIMICGWNDPLIPAITQIFSFNIWFSVFVDICVSAVWQEMAPIVSYCWNWQIKNVIASRIFFIGWELFKSKETWFDMNWTWGTLNIYFVPGKCCFPSFCIL